VHRASYGPHGQGARVGYTTLDSPFGVMLIAATPHGLCWLGLIDSAAHLADELRSDLRAAEIVPDDRAVAPLARRIVDFIMDGAPSLDVPLDIRATSFQFAVWRELCTIPWGETRSYGEIARRLGRPEASRAVGHANGSNPLAIVIPCHRAIGTDGGLTGYRWGVEYKRRLLEHERALAQISLQFG
jgi:AraC family transcriptional regulator, regulatory protein of adaptative response / methylated-DNA-[protein]-cysteine methyltransferase